MRELIKLFAQILKALMLQNKKLQHIEGRLNHMATRAEFNEALTEIQAAIEADVAQDVKVVEAINALIAKLEAAGNVDFQVEVDALKAATAKLSSDNAAVQAAVDAAVPPANP